MHSSKGLEFPVVIISDICATFKGKDRNPLPFDEKYFFAPQCFDFENRLVYPTLLKRLEEKKADAEELKNEYNLFYVACTRAMCNLHILAKEKPEFIKSRLYSADCYADMFDLSGYPAETVEICGDVEKKQNAAFIVSPDPVMKSEIEKRFGREYAFKESVNLPVKSSASAILKLYGGGETLNANELFDGEGETNTDIGIAYHRFLELCDFTKREPEQIKAEIKKFLIGGGISPEQSEILDIDRLSEILKMPAFDGLENMRVYREREFLCRLPAKEILDTDSNDEVLVQGAIDLLAETKDGYKIIDYKYSGKSDLYLAEHYSAQLNLYRKAVAKITHTDINTVSAVIVNLLHKRQIVLK